MKKLFLSFAPTILWLEIVLFCCIFASCESKEIDEKNKDKVNKSADSLKISTRKIDTSKKIINNENLAEKSDEKSTEKPAKKLDSTAIKVKLTKKWEITGNYWVSSLETFNNNEN